MKYKIVQYIGERPRGRMRLTVCDNLEVWAAHNGIRIYGRNDNARNRIELQGQPLLMGFCGPMWDGDAVRYEDAISNDILST